MKESKPKRIFLSPPHMGGDEMRFAQGALESNYIAPLGPQVDAFEREFCDKMGMPYAAALLRISSSGGCVSPPERR